MYHKLQLKTEKSNNQCLRIFLFVWKKLGIHFYNSGLNPLISHYLSSREGGGGGGREMRSHMVFGVTVGGSVVVNRVHKGETTEN